jgi:hypothetical protein
MTKHTPGPWVLRGEAHAEDGADETQVSFGVDPAIDGKSGGWPYLIRQDREFAMGEGVLHLAHGIQIAADARLIAAAPDMLAALAEAHFILQSVAAADPTWTEAAVTRDRISTMIAKARGAA